MTLGAAGEAFFDSLSEEEHNADERAWVARDISETNCQEPQNKTGRKVTLKTSEYVPSLAIVIFVGFCLVQ